MFGRPVALLAASVLVVSGSLLPAQEKEVVLRVGHFPNVTHAQALVAHHLSRQGKGWFEERLGAGVRIEWSLYNAGPSAMEAIFANALDITYVGPNPAINAYVKSKGAEVRVIAGSARGGAALVVHGDSPIRTAADFKGKKIATPQFGNTQDVACRAWLKEQGFRITMTGGDVHVVPTANPDQISLFQRRLIDGVWTVEPWVSRLEKEAGGRVFLDEGEESLTTVLVSSVKMLREKPELARRFARAHAELTEWMNANPAQAQKMVADELTALMRAPFPLELVESAWKRLHFSPETRREDFERFLAMARSVGFLREADNLARLVEVPR